LPWLHAATVTDGSVQLCCVAEGASGINLNEQTLADYWQSPYVKEARRRMLAGQRVAACAHCYREEAHGYRSHRLVENEVWQNRCGEDGIRQLVDRTGPDGSVDAPIQYVDLRLGNTCNMQCIMCEPRQSSRWVAAARKLSQMSQQQELKNVWRLKGAIPANRFEWYRNNAFWDNLKTFLPAVKEIILAGGEPFLIAEQFEFVKACCELGEANHIRLRYHTNATVFPEEMIPYWKKFEFVHFLVSLDAIENAANYVRYPTDWREIERNVRGFDGLGGNTLTSFNFTAHALNAWRIPEFLDWADRSRFSNRQRFRHMQDYVGVSLVHDPQYQRVSVLPADCKQLITACITDYIKEHLTGQHVDQLRAVINFMNAEDRSDKMHSLVEYTRLLDRNRGTDFTKTFPELAPYWARYEPGRAVTSDVAKGLPL
jgi:MoaA/NifB/PqqE/SkfB family radical SAM enzyme